MSAEPTITLRPTTEADALLTLQIYASTREYELSMVPWPDEQKIAFVEMQNRLQLADYRANYPNASFDIVETEAGPVGRLYVDRRENEFCILDITILTPYRGAGLGGRLLNQVIREAESVGKPVTIHVEKYNPALRLYQRLGFVEIGSNDIYMLMERLPAPSSSPSSPA